MVAVNSKRAASMAGNFPSNTLLCFISVGFPMARDGPVNL
jgi:hypothetical protein